MVEHALDVLEFPACLELVAGRATSGLGREAVRSLAPQDDPAAMVEELERVAEAMRLLERGKSVAVPEIPDARTALRRLGTEGSVLEPVELQAIGMLLASGRTLRSQLRPFAEALPRLARLAQQLHEERAAERAIGRTIGPDGTVLDAASPALTRVRAAIHRLRLAIVRRLESVLRSLPEAWVVPDASVSVRDGRYVIPIRREGRSTVGGIIHGESQSGQTLFVEPPVALEMMNELRDLGAEEAREVLRILRQLSEKLRPHAPLLLASQEALVTFDSLCARARYALDVDGRVPWLRPPGTPSYTVVHGRHPLLLAAGAPVVPFDLHLERGERAVVVSGPNTGGKSVLLKAAGLISAMAQSGIVPPVGEGTELPAFTEIFADIGDEQSVARSLSTFAAHLGNLKEIVERAGPGSLVLVDEIGTGTDPAEGAALACAVVVELVRRDALAFVTSHLGPLKRLAGEGNGIVNVSLQFDPDRMQPTYVLAKGRPGRSYGLAIARRLGLAARVLNEAERYRPSGEREVEELLETLERKEKEAAELLAMLGAERAQLERSRTELERRDAEVRGREAAVRRDGRRQVRDYLRAARAEVEAAIAEVRGALDQTRLEEAARRARRRVEEAIRELGAGAPDAGAGREAAGQAMPVRPGDPVRIGPAGAAGVVVELRDERAVVEMSGMRMDVAAAALVPAGETKSGERVRRPERPDAGWRGAEIDASPEVDLRGLRVEEVESALARALDEAILAELAQMRIIHGKGTGALRTRVRELLAAEARVRGFRPGRAGEGGAGVTVVEL